MQRRTASTAIALMALVFTSAAATPALGDGSEQPPTVTVVATGLDSPRKLSFAPNGDLYVAESGAPSASPGACFVHPQFGDVCVHHTGAITKISKQGVQTRVVEGLPSGVSAEEANGPFDVLVKGNTLTIAMGIGGSLENRDQLGADGALLGTVIETKLKGKQAEPKLVADLLAFEAAHNPDEGEIDSNPVDLLRVGKDLVAVDAGGNDVLLLGGKDDGVRGALAVLDPVLVSPAPFPGAPDPFPAQPVPTVATVGPDGLLYVGQLTGFPFQQGAASIYRYGDNGLEVYATGLTNVTDIAFKGKTLYAVQISATGLQTGVTGSLVKVDPGGNHTTVVGDLFAPYGLAIRGHDAYVTTGSVAPGGQVVKVSLR
ncbi:hypothetical protein GCM10028820_19650 [Tessaracoccus terricola]